ncbi:MAG: glycosyl transferase family 2 [Nitrospirae bacterium RBG_19FT_COMBO_58_9]|nr:MAG: glycosyl transferase family 2 [Nitrospirae bacterium RBG_19FT_COMBO_58_9]
MEILVGIPSYNNADTIGHVVRAVSAGLAKYFPGLRAVLVNSDGGSSDGTSDAVSRAVVDFGALLISDQQSRLQKIITPYHGIPGKGSAFRTIFEIARRLNAKACAVVDSDLRSITPEWIELLLRPILDENYDYVAPYYLRHKYDGTITNSIVYPLTRALYGQRIRQPIGGDFGFSGRLTDHYLDQHVWESDVARFGIDIWMTTEAIASGARVCQSFLGAKIHNPKDPTSDLAAMLMQVLGAVFALMEAHHQVWSSRRGSTPVKVFGFQYDVGVEPVNVNVERMIASFQQGLTDLAPIWEQVLGRETVAELLPLQAASFAEFRIPDDLWVRVIYEAALAYRARLMPREHLLKALTPLYLGRTATFVLETQGLTTAEAEGRIEQLCLAYEARKSCLVERWNQEPRM